MHEPPFFEIHTIDADGVTVVVVSGEIDMISEDALAAAMKRATDPVVLDLCACVFSDSTPISIIEQRSRQSPGQFRIACMPTGPAARVIEILLRDLVPIYRSREEAVAASRSEAAPESAA